MSYLGKISALVTVNTGDFAPKLNAAAKDVRSFARQVESNIGSAMRNAAKSFADIYTPLQKFERSMQAAQSMKLSFAGFAGAIKDIDTLKQRLTSLSNRQVDVVLKTSGMRDITAFRDAIYGLQSKQFDLMLKVGGAEKLEEISRVLAAGGEGFEVVVQTQQALAKVQSLRAEVESAKSAAADVTIAVDTTAVDAAREKVRRATQELQAYTVKTSEGSITEPKQLREEALSQRVAVGNRIEAMKAGKAKAASVEAAEEEYRQLSKVIKDLSALQRQKREAEKELSSAERAATPGAGIKAMERDLRSAERAYKELVQEAQKKIVAQFGVKMDVADIESILDGSAVDATRRLQSAFEAAGMSAAEAATRVQRVMDELGRSDLDAKSAEMRQMISATEAIIKPFVAAKDTIAGMSSSIQSQFLPTLSQTQTQIEQLQDAIKRDDGPNAAKELESIFAALERKVEGSIEAVGRLKEATAKLSQLKSGRELVFDAPQLSAALGRGAQIGNAAADLPAAAIQANPKIAQGLVLINELSNKAVAAYAKLQAKQAEGLPTAASQRALEKVLERLRAVQDAADQEIQVQIADEQARQKLEGLKAALQAVRENVTFVVTGRVQNLDQAKQEFSRLIAEVEKFDQAQREAFSVDLRRVGQLIEVGDTSQLDTIVKKLDDIRKRAGDQTKVNVDTAEAQQRLDSLRATLATVRENVTFAITGRVQNLDQARQEFGKLLGEVEKFTQAQKAAFGVDLRRLGQLVEAGDVTKLNDVIQLIDTLKERAAEQARVNVETETAQKAVDALTARLNTLRESATFTITGDVQNAGQAEAEVARIIGRLGELNEVQRQEIVPRVNSAITSLSARDSDGNPDLTEMRRAVSELDEEFERQRELKVNTDAAEKNIDGVRSRLRDLRDSMNFAGSGLVQTFEQARAQVDRLVSRFNSLDSSGQSQVRGEINSLLSGMEANPGQFDAEAIRRVELLVSSVERASDATRNLKSEMASIAAGLAPPSAPIDLLRRSLAEARKAIDQLDGPARAAGERNLRRIATYIDNNKGDEAAALRAAQAAERVRGEAEQVASRPTSLPVGYFQDQMRRSAQAELGGGLGSLDKQLGRFGSSIVAVKSQLTLLPEEVRSHFIPAIQAAEQEFIRLRVLGVHATAEEIERANNNMRVLEASAKRATTAFNFRSSMGGANAQELELNLQGRSLTGYQAQLQILQQALGRVSSEARGPAAASFLALQDAISTSFQNGTLDSRTTRAEIQRLTADAVQATARVANIGVGTLGRQVARAGDVGRRGFDNLSLAINQGAFAIDDFLSSTGGLEFKLRAVSNNITQMAFILGGTTGLFIGLGAVIAGQVAVGLIKWANGGRTAEDVTKALNDALARQKSLVEELGQAFRSLSDTIGRQAFSEPAQQAREFQNQLADIIRKQRELSRARVADVDVGVQRERATQNRLSRELEKEEDPRRRVALSRQLEESRANERRFADAAAATEAPTGQDVANYLNRVIDRYEIVARNLREGVEAGTIIPSAGEVAATGLPGNLRREMQGMPVGGDVGSITKQIETLRSAQDFLKPIGTETIMGFQTPMARQANAALQQIEELIQRLQAVALDKAFTEAAKNIIEGSNRAGRLIASAQQDVADAIRRGVPAAVGFQVQLDRMGAELQAANDALAAAQEMAPGQRRTAAVERAQARVADVEARRTEIEASARAARLGRGFGGERTTSALSRLQGNDRFENERAGLTARVRAAVDNEIVARRRLEASQEQEAQRRKAVVDAELAVSNAATDAEKAAAQEALNAARASEAAATASREKAQADAEAAAKASDLVASLAEFALSVEQTIARLRKIGDSALQRSEGGADAAQRALEEGRGTAVARDAAERNLIADRERLAKANNALDHTRSEAMNSPEMQAIRQERERVESELKDIEAKNAEAMANNGAVPGEDLAAAQARQDRLAELARQEAEVMDEATRKRREELDAIAKSIAARERELERGRKRDEEGNEFNRQRGMVDETVTAAERRRDEAQRRFEASQTPENLDRLTADDEEVRRSRQRQQELQDRMDREERAFNNRDDVKKRRDEIAAREAERAALIAKEAGGETLTAAEQKRIKEIDDQNRRDRSVMDREREAATVVTRSDIEDERRRQAQLDAADRGRELGMTDRERFRREMETGVGFDIRARAAQVRGEGGDVQGFLRQAIANQIEKVAPMLAQFKEERENAILQGPSRAALQISDVTTGQGMSELNRLLRGDDPSKDVNLAELRKQTDKLTELVDVVKNNPLPVL